MIQVDNIHVYYGDVEALSDVSFSVEKGGFTAVMGRNGVGKTTLMKTLVGILSSAEGTVSFDGEDVTSLPAYKRVKKGIGYVPQGRQIFPRLTVEENIFTGMDKVQGEVIEEVYEYFPVLKEMRSRYGGDLSGGQQQQLAIARALVTKPELLILDEPTEGIQPNIIQKIGEVLRILKNEQGMTILFVEQYLDFIKEFSSGFLIMNSGSIVASGETKDLSKELVEEYLRV